MLLPYHQLRLSRVLLLFLFFLIGTIDSELYGAARDTNGSKSSLYLIRTTPTGGILAGTRIGDISVNGNFPVIVSGMAFDRQNRNLGGQMYGVTAANSPYFPNSLIRIDLNSGFATLVAGNSGLPNLAGLAVSNVGDVYSWWTGYDDTRREDDLVKFELLGPLIGIAIVVGNTAIVTPGPTPPHSIGMDFDRSDDTKIHFLNGDGVYYTIDVANGQATRRGEIALNRFTFPNSQTGSWSLDPETLPKRIFYNVERDRKTTVDVNTRIQIIDLDQRTATADYITNVNGLDAIAFTYDTTQMPSAMPSAVPSKMPSAKPSAVPSKSNAPTLSAAPSSVPSVSDPCQRNQCSFLLGIVTSGRQVSKEFFGFCYAKCTFPLFATALTWVGWECGGC